MVCHRLLVFASAEQIFRKNKGVELSAQSLWHRAAMAPDGLISSQPVRPQTPAAAPLTLEIVHTM